MLTFLKKFKRMIATTLIEMMVVTILLATIELAWLIIKDIITPPVILLEIDELLDIFGLFLLVLLGIELVSTLKTYLIENEIHVEVVFAIALIAIGRKVIILDVKEISSLSLGNSCHYHFPICGVFPGEASLSWQRFTRSGEIKAPLNQVSGEETKRKPMKDQRSTT